MNKFCKIYEICIYTLQINVHNFECELVFKVTLLTLRLSENNAYLTADLNKMKNFLQLQILKQKFSAEKKWKEEKFIFKFQQPTNALPLKMH